MIFLSGGRPFLSDMARLIDAGRSKKLALDYVLCGLLLNKRLTEILPAFRWLLSLSKGRTIAGSL